jgi:hypothetical protein
MLQPSVTSLKEFQAVTLALKAASKELRTAINRATRDTVGPIWKEEVNARAGAHVMANKVLTKGARVAAGNPARAVAGSSRKALSGGLIPDQANRAFEFGSTNRESKSTYRSRRGGKSFNVTRRTRRQLPPFRKGGYVVFPAWRKTAPRMVSLYTQLIMKKVYEAFGE